MVRSVNRLSYRSTPRTVSAERALTDKFTTRSLSPGPGLELFGSRNGSQGVFDKFEFFL